MYTVIFRAEINELDDLYYQQSQQMQELALNTYGCSEFTSVTEGSNEITISYWNSLDDIQQWKKNTAHLEAQKLGRSKWYKSYQVQILEVIREYKR